jgi:hypothetical protein
MTTSEKQTTPRRRKNGASTTSSASSGAPSGPTISESEAAVVAVIRQFKNPVEGWLQNAADFADYPLDKAGDLLFENPIGDRLDEPVLRATRALNEIAQASLRRDSVFHSFSSRGIEVDELEDIRELGIDQINECLGGLATKYQTMGAALGATSGAFGVAGAVIDVPVFFLTALRAIGEYATYFGFDMNDPGEREFALLTLATAATVTDASRQQALIEVTRTSVRLAGEQNVDPKQKQVSSALLKRVAQAVVIRSVKGRIGRFFPLVGTVFGGGYGLLFLSEVCKTAYALYAERWLMQKHGPKVVTNVLAPF